MKTVKENAMKKTIVLCGLSLLLLLSACAAQTPPSNGADSAASAPAQATVLSAEEAHTRMGSGDPLVILDVRTAEEFAEKHIPGAVLLPNEEIGSTPPEMLPVKDTEILVYCRSGNRSAQAAKKLADMGYTKVYDFGGIKDWGYETESGDYEAPEKAGTLSSFTAYDLNGLPVDEGIFAGHDLTMINIWATFCGPCLREMPDLGQLSQEYADRGVAIVGIVADVSRSADGTFSDDMVSTARELVAQTGAGYLHLLPSDDLVSAKLGQVSAVPETIFVDSQGNLVGESYVGSRSKADWAQVIDTLLPEAQA